MSNVHAAIGLAQIQVLEPTIAAKRRLAAAYDELLARLPVERPALVEGHVWWRYGCLLKSARPRDVHARLLERGIETLPPFTPMYRIPMYRAGYRPEEFPVAEDAYRRTLALPISPYLGRTDVEAIVRELQQALEAAREPIGALSA
jgi:dTDP-4-amino-4,6-dideoxygalactose transaminase